MSEPSWNRLHPASVLVNLLPRTWRFIRNAWPLLLLVIWGGNNPMEGSINLALLTLFFASTVGATVLHWATLRYRVHAGRLEIETGLVNRQTRVIDPRRIQNIELTRNVLHRLTGMVEVRLETASGTEAEGLLSALSEADGAALVQALSVARGRVEEALQDELIVGNDLGDLFRFGATAARLGAGIAIAFGLAMEGLQLMQPDDLDRAVSLTGWPLAAAFIAILTGTWLFGIGAAIVSHYGFRLAKAGDRLVASGGLLTTRRVELPLSKVQVVSVREPLLRRLAGFGSVVVETAAAGEGSGGTVSTEAMVPVVGAGAFGQVARAALPAAPATVWTDPLHPPHPNAIKRRLLGATIRGVLLGALLALIFWPWGLVFAVIVPAFTLATGWLDVRHQGWRIADGMVMTRSGYLDRQTAIVPITKLQSVDVQQGPFQRSWGLGRLVVKVAGTAVALPDLAFEQARALQDALIVELRRSLVRVDPAVVEEGAAVDEAAHGGELPNHGEV